MKEERKSAITPHIENLMKELTPIVEQSGGGKIGVVVFAFDEGEKEEDGVVCDAILLGNKGVMIRGIAKTMDKNDDIKGVIEESNRFHRFMKNPLAGLLSMIEKFDK